MFVYHDLFFLIIIMHVFERLNLYYRYVKVY